MRDTIAAPRAAKGPQVDKLYQHDAVCCRAVAMHPGRGTTLLSPKKSQALHSPRLKQSCKNSTVSPTPLKQEYSDLEHNSQGQMAVFIRQRQTRSRILFLCLIYFSGCPRSGQ